MGLSDHDRFGCEHYLPDDFCPLCPERVNHLTDRNGDLPIISATLVGLPYVQRLRGHVNVDLVPISLPKPARRVLAIFTLCASIAIIAMMLWHGYENWHIAWTRGWKSDTVWGVRLWTPFLAMPVGFGLFLLQLVANLVAVILKFNQPFGLEDT